MLNDVDFQELLEKYDYNYSIGDVVKGRIVSVEKDCVFVDIKAKANACCPIYEVLLEKNQNLADVFEVNQEYDFMINSAQDENGVFYLSYKKVAILFMARGDYEDAIEYFEDYMELDIPEEEKSKIRELIERIKKKQNG